MRKVAHPTCLSCGKTHPEFESDRLGVRVCYQCLLGFSTWLHRKGLLMDNHPLVTELFDGVFNGGVVSTPDQMPVVIRSELGNSVFSFIAVQKYRDSETSA